MSINILLIIFVAQEILIVHCCEYLTHFRTINTAKMNGRTHRKLVQTGLRIPVDQLKDLRELKRVKYRDLVSMATLLRMAVDDFIDKEFGRTYPKKQ
jgi:hypothetical protein